MRAALALLSILGLAAPASAQTTAELRGTFVRYVAVSANGVMAADDAAGDVACVMSCVCDAASAFCIDQRSMRYTEDGTAASANCDAFQPRGAETFTIVAVRADGAILNGHDRIDAAALVRTSGPTLIDRTIHWEGRLEDASHTPALRVELDWSYQTDDRVVSLTTTLTNVGTQSIPDLYFLRNANPDFGFCVATGMGTASTSNDVRRQPPDGSDALVTASAGGWVLGIGAHDDRARACTGGNESSDAVGEWSTPRDADGAIADAAIDLAFRLTSLDPGDRESFEMFYVWGTSLADVETRFDAVGSGASTCAGVADGTACSAPSGARGVCHRTSCCVGCWDPSTSRCVPGTSALVCGAAGADCQSCTDGVDCTSDVCGLGTCTNPPAPVGTACEDGMFCTANDRCDATGHCIAGGPNACSDGQSCTTDACDEGRRACTHPLVSGCLIGGQCVANGTRAAGYPCLVCDEAQNASDWTPGPVGTSCGASYCARGSLFSGGQCDASGACSGGSHTPCATRLCADASTCTTPCTEGSCGAGQRCGANMRCVSLAANGTACGSDDECSSMHCTDGVCCEEPCDGLCAACDLPDMRGRCEGIPNGSDPIAECAGRLVCDGHGACRDPSPNDAGMRVDGGADAGDVTPPPVRRACGCSTPGAGGGGLGAILAILAVLVSRARRAW